MNLTAEDKAKFKAELEEAVDRLFADEQKPEHYDGEPFKGSIYQEDKKHLKDGEALVYAIRRPVENCEWYVSESGDSCGMALYSGRLYARITRWILRAVPVSQWKPGDYAYSIKNKAIVQIQKAAWGATRIGFAPIHECKDANGTIWKSSQIPVREAERELRPLQDADWTREIAGVKVRAYEDEEGDIQLRTADDYSWLGVKKFMPIARELCRLAGIPIMPYELSKGEDKAPV